MEPEGPARVNADTLWESFVRLADRLDERFLLREKFYVTKEYAYEHPIISLFVLVAAAMASIPLMGFMCFVISTVLLSVLGFMFFEGSILLFGSIVLGGILCFTGVVSLAFTSCLVLSYFLFNASCGFFDKFRSRVEKYSPDCLNGVQWRFKSSKEE